MDSQSQYASRIVSLVDKNIVRLSDMARLNAGKMVSPDHLSYIVEAKIKKRILNPKIYSLLLGDSTEKYLLKMKDFLRIVSLRIDTPIDEMYSYFGFILLLNQTNSQLLRKMGLSASLARTIEQKIGGLKKTNFLAMDFIVSFLYTIATFAYEIGIKYDNADVSQKPKILKLYNSKERLRMLLNAAYSNAAKTLTGNQFETKEVVSCAKIFLSRNPDLITTSDMFDGG